MPLNKLNQNLTAKYASKVHFQSFSKWRNRLFYLSLLLLPYIYVDIRTTNFISLLNLLAFFLFSFCLFQNLQTPFLGVVYKVIWQQKKSELHFYYCSVIHIGKNAFFSPPRLSLQNSHLSLLLTNHRQSTSPLHLE